MDFSEKQWLDIQALPREVPSLPSLSQRSVLQEKPSSPPPPPSVSQKRKKGSKKFHKSSKRVTLTKKATGKQTLSGGEALVHISGESVHSQAGAVNPSDLSADLESHASVKITPLSSSSRVDTLADDLDQSPVHTGARSPIVTTKSSSTLGVTRGRDRVKSVHSGTTTSIMKKKSNSSKESPILYDQSPEREHSPEPLDTMYPEEEGSLPSGQSSQDPSDYESLDSGLHRDLPDVRLRSSPKISHISHSRELHQTPHHPPN